MLLSLEAITVRRDGHTLLSDIDWQVKPGENWIVLGPNGSGKTTLLSVICGYQAPTQGEFSLFGNRYGRADWNAVRRKIGLVSNSLSRSIQASEPAEHVVLSGKFAMLNFWGRVKSTDRDASVAMMERVGCGELAGRRWGVLSQGERQRLMIARGLMGSPRLLLLDEPCAGLDVVAREAFLKFLQNLLKEKDIPSTVLITHHVEELVPGFKHLLLLGRGHGVAQGKLHEVMKPSVMKKAYGSSLRIERVGQRWKATVASKGW